MISLIVAHDPNLVIGKDNKLPWYYPEDLRYFKKITTGKDVLMGRKTFDSIISKLGNSLPNRTTHVLTRSQKTGCDVNLYHSVEEVLKDFRKEELFVVGGASIYEAFLPFADCLYITLIHKIYEGDSYFPSYENLNFKKISQSEKEDLTFLIYEKI